MAKPARLLQGMGSPGHSLQRYAIAAGRSRSRRTRSWGSAFSPRVLKRRIGLAQKSFHRGHAAFTKNWRSGWLLTGGELRKLLRKAAQPVGLLPDAVPYTPAIAAAREALEPAAEMVKPIPETPRVIDFEGRA